MSRMRLTARCAARLILPFCLVLACFSGCYNPASRTTDQLISDLGKSSAGGWREDAARELGKRGEAGVDALIEAIDNDPWSSVREAAVLSLGKIGGHRAVDALITLLQRPPDPNPRKDYNGQLKSKADELRGTAARTLGQLGDSRALDPLVKGLDDPTWDVQYGAIEGLAKLGHPGAIAPLMAYMKRETNQYMKSAGNESAANALVQLGDSADSALIACLKDADTKVREAVTHAIANTKEPRFVVPLIDVLTDATSTGRQRFEAAKGLGEVKDPRAIDALRKCTRGPEGEWLIGPTYSASYGDLDVACEAANALKKLGWQPRDRNEEAYFWLCSRSRLEIALNADRVREVIVAEAKAPRKDRMTRAVYLAIEIGNEDTVTGLIGALNEGGDVTMAETFLNCGHSGLAQAAKDWATANGFKITAGNGAQKARWGRL